MSQQEAHSAQPVGVEAPDGTRRFQKKLGDMLKARFPLIYLMTQEEERAQALIQEVVKTTQYIKTPRRLFMWSVLDGLKTTRGAHKPEINTLEKLFEMIQTYPEPAVFVVQDAQFLYETRPDAATIMQFRKLKQMFDALRFSEHPVNVIFVGSTGQICPDLQVLVHSLELPLPSSREIRTLLKEMIHANCEQGQVKLELTEEHEEMLVRAALGMTLLEAENAFSYAMVHDNKLCVSDIQTIIEEKCQAIKKTDILEFVQADVNFQDVAGLEVLKQWLIKRNGSWLDSAKKYSLPAPRGILLTGVPGCGKSLTAKAMSSIWELPLLKLDPGRIYNSMMGGSEQNIRQVIKLVEAISPCVLWIDEIEKGLNMSSGTGDSGTSNRVFGTFLSWLQEKTKPVFVIATANNIDNLPPEFLRKGRFDEIFFVDLPNQAERQAIWTLHLKKRLKDPDVIGDFKLNNQMIAALVAQTEGFSGAEIESVILNALYEAFHEKRAIRLDDLYRAIQTTVPLSQTQYEKISNLREWALSRTTLASLPDKPAAFSPQANTQTAAYYSKGTGQY